MRKSSAIGAVLWIALVAAGCVAEVEDLGEGVAGIEEAEGETDETAADEGTAAAATVVPVIGTPATALRSLSEACRPLRCRLPGDYNGDGAVTSADHDTWRSGYGAGAGHPADGSGDGTVDAADYVIWRRMLGQTCATLPPTRIATAADLRAMQSHTAYVLANDIVVTGGFEPIDGDDIHLDGAGHEIFGLQVYGGEDSRSGLFGELRRGCIRSLTFRNARISGEQAGAVAGLVDAVGADGQAFFRIDDVHVHFAESIGGTHTTGGLVGELRSRVPGEIAITRVTVEGTPVQDHEWSAGGLVGRTDAPGLFIDDAHVRPRYGLGSSVSAAETVGGLVGRLDGSDVTISRSTVEGAEIRAEVAGGLVGHVGGSGLLIHSSHLMPNGTRSASVIGGQRHHAGGLIGVLYGADAELVDCSGAGSVRAHSSIDSGDGTAGGLAGHVSGDRFLIGNSRWDGPVRADVAGGLVGTLYGRDATISGSRATGDVGASPIHGSSAGGGLVGRFSHSGVPVLPSNLRLLSSHFDGTVQGYYAGGVAGGIEGFTATIDGCTARGSVTGDGGVGGLVGWIHYTDWGAVSDYAFRIQGSSSSMTVSGPASYIQGIVGTVTRGARVPPTAPAPIITGTSFTGTLVPR